MTPTYTMGDVRTNTTYYDGVRVPHENLVGGENQGWGLIVSQLNHERVSLTPHGPSTLMLEQVADDPRRLVPALDAGGHDLVVGVPHAVELQRAHPIQDLGAVHQLAFLSVS